MSKILKITPLIFEKLLEAEFKIVHQRIGRQKIIEVWGTNGFIIDFFVCRLDIKNIYKELDRIKRLDNSDADKIKLIIDSFFRSKKIENILND